jgi:hypothetical protein
MAIALLNRDVTYSIVELLNIQDLISVALVSQQFTSIAQELLFRNVELNRESFRRNKRLKLADFNLFARALRENVALGGLVRNLGLGADFAQGISLQQVQQLLAGLCNLQCLSLWVTGTAPLTGLLWGCLTSVPMNMPRLRTIKIQGNHYSISRIEQHIAQVPHTVPLETIVLGNNISLDALHQALIPFRSLQSLSCKMPSVRRPNSDDGLSGMSPMAFASSLQPVAATLTELKVSGEQTWRIHDTTRLDLSSFNALKLLAVPHFLLFESYEAHTSREGVYLLLPPTLRELKVFMDPTSSKHWYILKLLE